jgi:hypothetical protein
MIKLSKRHFWEWFRRHHSEYLALSNKSNKEAAYWLNELNAHLRAYFKFLEYCLHWQSEQTSALIITVDGKAQHFKKVDDLVAKAPAIPGWNFVALEDPKPIDFLLKPEIEETGIDPRELCFSFASNALRTELIIYHLLCTPENKHLLYELAYAAVYNLLGERSFGMDIRGIRVANLSAADSDEVEALEALPECIGRRRSGIIVDSQGNMVMD